MLNKIKHWYFTKNALSYWMVLAVDCAICFASGLFVFWTFFRGVQTLGNIVPVSKTLMFFMVFNLISFKMFHTYAGIVRYSSFVDLVKVAKAMTFACACATLFQLFVVLPNRQLFEIHLVPLHFRHIVSIYIVSTIGMWAIRVMVKTFYDIAFSSDKGMRTFVYGVKDGGVGLAKSIRNVQPSRFQLKGFIAHEANFQNKVLMGVKVYEVNPELSEIIKSMNIEAVLISPLQNERFRNDQLLQDILQKTNMKVYMLHQQELNGQKDYSTSHLKEIKIEDLLPRDEIEVDMVKIGEMLRGKKILLTGSAGSIGSEILRQVCTYSPSELYLIDIAETPQHDISLMMAKDFPNIKAHTIVGSITNKKRMEEIFSNFRPDYVFHAAAYKHVPMMESNPSESIENNVYGTKVIADLSDKYGVKKFVMLSTDKAVNPTNVMGCSKRICEIYVQSLNAISNTQFVTTRFGNVLGSNGSVIPLFEQQIRNGGPVTVTDPNIIRYFMLIPEACKLVLEAGTHGKGGEIFVFDMGKPVRIAELAKRMIWLSGATDVEIEYTGLRPGEKLYEEVLLNEEDTIPSFHQKIRIAKVLEYDFNSVSVQIEQLIELAQTFDSMAIVKKMKEIVPEFISNNSVYSVLDKKD